MSSFALCLVMGQNVDNRDKEYSLFVSILGSCVFSCFVVRLAYLLSSSAIPVVVTHVSMMHTIALLSFFHEIFPLHIRDCCGDHVCW